MHANMDILEIGQIEGLRVAKEINQVMMKTKGLVTQMTILMGSEAVMREKGLVIRMTVSTRTEAVMREKGLVTQMRAAMELEGKTAGTWRDPEMTISMRTKAVMNSKREMMVLMKTTNGLPMPGPVTTTISTVKIFINGGEWIYNICRRIRIRRCLWIWKNS